jgi:hypothetical protein
MRHKLRLSRHCSRSVTPPNTPVQRPRVRRRRRSNGMSAHGSSDGAVRHLFSPPAVRLQEAHEQSLRQIADQAAALDRFSATATGLRQQLDQAQQERADALSR